MMEEEDLLEVLGKPLGVKERRLPGRKFKEGKFKVGKFKEAVEKPPGKNPLQP